MSIFLDRCEKLFLSNSCTSAPLRMLSLEEFNLFNFSIVRTASIWSSLGMDEDNWQSGREFLENRWSESSKTLFFSSSEKRTCRCRIRHAWKPSRNQQ